jgi:alpha-D-ribose 1-methylphosphonate 5-triphosphate synthase subunit PhnG
MTEFSEEMQLRRHWIGILARASEQELEAAWARLTEKPGYQFLRAPEPGLAMVQARMGGTGRPFNLGEMTITRCTVRTKQGSVGHAYVAGRRPRHAELAAVFDALLQAGSCRDTLLQTLIRPLREQEEQRRHALGLKTAATKVDFFTMVRGHNGDQL